MIFITLVWIFSWLLVLVSGIAYVFSKNKEQEKTNAIILACQFIFNTVCVIIILIAKGGVS